MSLQDLMNSTLDEIVATFKPKMLARDAYAQILTYGVTRTLATLGETETRRLVDFVIERAARTVAS